MSAQIVLDYYLDKYQTLVNTLTDIDFGNLSFLQEKEPVYNSKGQKVSKSYYDTKGKEAIRITYERVIGNHQYNETVYPDVFLGLQKTIHFLDWAGEIAYSKKKQFYAFDLQPVFLANDNETIIGFSSQKQRQILKSERLSADDYLQAKYPVIYALLYAAYPDAYNLYLHTGISSGFINAINDETNPELLAVLNNKVSGYDSLIVKELIIMNLQ